MAQNIPKKYPSRLYFLTQESAELQLWPRGCTYDPRDKRLEVLSSIRAIGCDDIPDLWI